MTRATDDLFANILYRFDTVHARIVKDVELFASFFLVIFPLSLWLQSS